MINISNHSIYYLLGDEFIPHMYKFVTRRCQEHSDDKVKQQEFLRFVWLTMSLPYDFEKELSVNRDGYLVEYKQYRNVLQAKLDKFRNFKFDSL
jgi:hypothetical protein